MKEEIRAKLHKLYNLIPKVNCKGLCTHECTTIGMFKGEFIHLTRVSGKEPKLDVETERCNYLENERCTVYDDRPYVCRAYGATEAMICPHGCEPQPHYLPKEFEFLLMNEIGTLLGSHDLIFTASPEDLKSILLKNGCPPDEAEKMAKIMAQKRFQLEIISR